MRRISSGFVAAMISMGLAKAAWAVPAYTISSFAPVGTDTVGSGNWISPDGNLATGFSQRGNPNAASNAVLLSVGGSTPATALPNLVTTGPTRPFNQGLAVNNAGTVVGVAASTAFLSAPLPTIWRNGGVAQLPLPTGFNAGRAFAVNAADVAVGSGAATGVNEAAIRYTTAGSTALGELTTDGGRLITAYGISDGGAIVGQASTPLTAATNVPFYLPAGAAVARVIPAVDATRNGGIAFAVSPSGRYAVGSSGFNGGNGVPSIYDATSGANVAVPLPAGTTTGSLRSVNDAGNAVGTAGGQFAVPFYFDGTNSFPLNVLFDDPSWNVVMNTSSGAFSISNDDVIVGRAFRNGVLSAFVLTPVVPEPATVAAAFGGVALLVRRRRA